MRDFAKNFSSSLLRFCSISLSICRVFLFSCVRFCVQRDKRLDRTELNFYFLRQLANTTKRKMFLYDSKRFLIKFVLKILIVLKGMNCLGEAMELFCSFNLHFDENDENLLAFLSLRLSSTNKSRTLWSKSRMKVVKSLKRGTENS